MFICVIFLFYLNASGFFEKKNKIKNVYYYLILILFLFVNYDFPSELETFLPVELNIIDL